MTVICAAVGEAGVYVGSDGRVLSDDLVLTDSVFKWRIFGRGCFAIGAAGPQSLDAIAEAVANSVDWWSPAEDGWYEKFVPAIVKTIRHAAERVSSFQWQRCGDDDSMGHAAMSFTLASGPHHKIWLVPADLRTYNHVDRGYFAEGCGAEVAMGAMHVLRSIGVGPEEMVHSGCAAACELLTGCGGKITVRKLSSG